MLAIYFDKYMPLRGEFRIARLRVSQCRQRELITTDGQNETVEDIEEAVAELRSEQVSMSKNDLETR